MRLANIMGGMSYGKKPKPKYKEPERVIPKDFKEIYERGRTDYAFFIDEFLPHLLWGPKSEMHLAICDMEDKGERGTNSAIAAPRGNAKTSIGVIGKAIHAICYGYEDFILVLAYSRAEATDKVKDIKDELQNNEHIIEVFGELVPINAGKLGFVAKNKPKTRVLARSKGGQVRGLRHRKSRPTLILVDDIEDLKHVLSKEQRKKTKDWFMKDVMGSLQTDGSSNVRFYGTVLHQEALLIDLLNTPGWIRKRYSAIKKWSTRLDLWDKWENIYSDLENENAQIDARNFYIKNEADMLDGVEVLWPEGDPYYKLMEYKVRFGVASLYSEKLNDPYDPDAQILHPEKCKRFRVLWPGDPAWPEKNRRQIWGYCIQWVDIPERVYHCSELEIIAAYDPSIAEHNKSDYAAISVDAQDSSGYIYNLETWQEKRPYQRQIDKLFQLADLWCFKTIYMEAVNFQRLLGPLINQEIDRRKVDGEFWDIEVIPINNHRNKEARIGRLEGYIDKQWLLFPETGAWVRLLFEQMIVFPTAEHDDGPDALEMAINKLRMPGGKGFTSGGDNMSAIA